MKIAILGCGPAGLIAAHTALASDATADVRVISKKQKSIIGGAQYLHEPVVGVSGLEPDGHIDFTKLGDAAGYAEKVYGTSNTETSWEAHHGTVEAWSLRDVYDRLWETMEDEITDQIVDADFADRLGGFGYDLVFSTIPKSALCYKDHNFTSQEIAIQPGSPVKRLDNFVMYNGRPTELWYRTSRIFGESWTEYSKASGFLSAIPAMSQRGFKPLWNDCDCHPNLIPIGRYGIWKRGVLLHHVMDRVRQAVEHARGHRADLFHGAGGGTGHTSELG